MIRCMVGPNARAEQWVTSVQSTSIETANEDNPLARPTAFQIFQADSAERCEEQPATTSARQKTREVRHGDTAVSGQVWRHFL